MRVEILASHSDYPAPDGFTTVGRTGTVLGPVPEHSREMFPNGLRVQLDRTPDCPNGLVIYAHAEHTKEA